MFLKPRIHLCLLYNTAPANITPALDPDFRPEQVILVHGHKQQKRADNLKQILRGVGVDVVCRKIEDIWDLDRIRRSLEELLLEENYLDKDIALNASGGTRPMSLAAYALFSSADKPIFYVHPHSDEIIWLHDQQIQGFNVANRIKIPAYFKAFGAECTINHRQPLSADLRNFTATLVEHTAYYRRDLSTLNWLAKQAEKELQVDINRGRVNLSDSLDELISLFVEQGLCHFDGRILAFDDENARFFVNGGWLEYHVFAQIQGLRKSYPCIQDIAQGVEVIRHQSGRAVKNEIDVAFLANNHLYLIECKTKRYHAQQQNKNNLASLDTPGADTLYKLDTLKGLLGNMRTHVMLASYHDVSRWDKQRAKDLNVLLASTQQLHQLKSLIGRWINDSNHNT